MSDFDRFDVDSASDYDFYYEENIYKDGKGIGRKSSPSNAGIIGTVAYLGLMGMGLFIAVLCPPIGVLFILGGYALRDSLN